MHSLNSFNAQFVPEIYCSPLHEKSLFILNNVLLNCKTILRYFSHFHGALFANSNPRLVDVIVYARMLSEHVDIESDLIQSEVLNAA